MATIRKIIAREILDSRGVPTIEGKLVMDDGRYVLAAASSGESLGKFEGVEIRDRDERYEGMGVKKAVSYINSLIGPKLAGVKISDPSIIDKWLVKADGTENQSKLGVNSMMVISQLVLKAAAASAGLPLYLYINQEYQKTYNQPIKIERVPAPIFSMITGGKHGSRNLDFQEFQIVPLTSIKFTSALELAAVFYAELKKVLEYRNAGISVSEEGGFTPNLLTNIDAMQIMKETLTQKKLRLGVDVFMGTDAAASQFWHEGKYKLKDKSQPMKTDEYIEFIKEIVATYNILFLEDPLQEEDYEGWKKLNKLIGHDIYIVGDDFIAGNKSRLERAVKEEACSAILIKFNQVGTLTDMFEIINIAKKENIKIAFAHRLGETNDSIISDISVAVQADFVKFGAPVRGERVAKYNRLLEIENEILKKE